GNVLQLEPGVYRYSPSGHSLDRVIEGDVRADLAEAALMQMWMANGAMMIVITAVYERTTGRYGERGIRYVHMEAGHAAQNLYLQATAMELGTVVVGAFQDDQVAEILQLPQEEKPLYLIPVGKIQG
ncbi:MAG: SagB/ThcOx family dehydrogenase, partial [Dehalococcoidia bacterium]